MKVVLLSHTQDMERLIASSAKLCYSPVGVEEISKDLTTGEIDKFLSKLMELEHDSPLEHATFTFAIEGVSRSLTHQLVRHRIASYTQQSQRYVYMESPDYVVPSKIRDNDEAYKVFSNHLNEVTKTYRKLASLGIPKEDARSVLPNATETKIVVTKNVRTLLHFFKLRCCDKAQEEIRELANKMLDVCKDVSPTLFRYAGANCRECSQFFDCKM